MSTQRTHINILLELTYFTNSTPAAVVPHFSTRTSSYIIFQTALRCIIFVVDVRIPRVARCNICSIYSRKCAACVLVCDHHTRSGAMRCERVSIVHPMSSEGSVKLFRRRTNDQRANKNVTGIFLMNSVCDVECDSYNIRAPTLYYIADPTTATTTTNVIKVGTNGDAVRARELCDDHRSQC